jgi:GNAT superfamily N-acetyltransferase
MMKSITVELPDGFLELPPGKFVAVQTFLEMRSPPPPKPDPPGVTAVLGRVERPDPDWYRALFHKIGDPYLWYARIEMSTPELLSIIHDPNEEVYAVEQDGVAEGLLELDFRTPGECEISYFGLTSKIVGTGIGRWLMNRAIARAWEKPISRFWVHTCTVDHPAALDFYRRSGFVPYARMIEFADDPRLTGLVPRDAAPQFPIV